MVRKPMELSRVNASLCRNTLYTQWSLVFQPFAVIARSKLMTLTQTMRIGMVEEAEQVLQLVELARDMGEPDTYPGKRGWSRYNAALPLEFTVDPHQTAGIAPATMHNISGGGVAFWSRKDIPLHSIVFIRGWSDESPTLWVGAKVCHATIGLKGFLIGAEFLSPAPRES